MYAPRQQSVTIHKSRLSHNDEIKANPWLMATESEEGLTAEFPFPGCMPPTALLEVDNETKHPQLGVDFSSYCGYL